MVLKRVYKFGWMVLHRDSGSVTDCMDCVKGVREEDLA